MMTSLQEEADPEDAIRITVVEGGNSGLQYSIDFDSHVQPDDAIHALPNGRHVLIDRVSIGLMADVTTDTTPVTGDPNGRPGFWFRRDK